MFVMDLFNSVDLGLNLGVKPHIPLRKRALFVQAGIPVHQRKNKLLHQKC